MRTVRPPRVHGDGQVCPVCRWPDQGSATCDQCGWELIGEYVLGPATRADEADLAARLMARCRHHDLRAAARAAGVTGDRDQAMLARLARLARGGPGQPGQLDDAVSEVDAQEPPLAATTAGMIFALTRLVGGETDAIAFVEIGADAVSVQALVSDDLGVPVRYSGDDLPWTAILPLLPVDTDMRYLRMAGGIGIDPDRSDADPAGQAVSPAILMAAIDEAIRPVLARLAAAASAAAAAGLAARGSGDSGRPSHRAPHRIDTVLVRRTHRWPLLEAAATRARSIMRPVTEIIVPPRAGQLAAVVDSAVGQAPLRYGYDLILVDVNWQNGAVRPRPYQLFAAGAAVTPGSQPTTRIALTAVPGHEASRLALPIVARRGPVEDFRDLAVLKIRRPLIKMAAINGKTYGTVLLDVGLRKPGQLSAQATPDLLPPDPTAAGWPELIGELPDRLPLEDLPRTDGVDLVLLVELGGDEERVAARVRLARGIVDALGGDPAVRVAVVGYRDHFGKHRVDAIAMEEQEGEALVVGCGLSQVDSARYVFSRPERWKAVPVGDDHAAPLEDALQLIAGSKWTWRPEARHVLLVVGSRPPHPPKAGRYGDVMLPCPHRYSWQDTLRLLRRYQAIECLAVLDHHTDPGYSQQAWQELGAQGDFAAESATPEQLAQVVGLTARTGTTQLCLAAYAGSAPLRSPRGESG